jgi:hypothetical protein
MDIFKARRSISNATRQVVGAVKNEVQIDRMSGGASARKGTARILSKVEKT